MKMKGGFRNTQWDPMLLCAQMIAIQSSLYVSLGMIMTFMDIFVGANHTLDHLFQYHVSINQSINAILYLPYKRFKFAQQNISWLYDVYDD